MSLQKVVRPYQTPDYTPGANTPTTPAVGTEQPTNVVVEIGLDGRGKLLGGSRNYSRSEYQDKRPREQLGGNRIINIELPATKFSNGQLQPPTP